MGSFNILVPGQFGFYTDLNAIQNAQTQPSQGALFNVNNGKSDESTFGEMLGSRVVWGDSQDKFHLSKAAGWEKKASNVKDEGSGFCGDVYRNNKGQLLMIAGDAAKNVDFVA